MTAGTLTIAADAYDRSNEQRFRSDVEQRLIDVERALYGLQTTYGTISLGEANLTLANGANSNVSPGYATYIRITGPTAAFTTTGFAGGESGRLMIIRNTVAYDWTIANQSASSSASNRIVTSVGASDVTLTAESVAVFVYDGTDSRWILVATQG